MPLTESQIRAIFAPAAIQGSQGQFFEHVADDVDWSIMGSSPMSKRYRSKAEFQVETLKILKEKVLTEPLRVRVLHVIVGANEGPRDECEAAIELEAVDAVCKNGAPYPMRYHWVCKFRKDMIVEVRAYLDSELLTRVIEQNP